MTSAGLPVPPGFIIATDACRRFLEAGRLPPGLMDEVAAAVADLERRSQRRFGGGPFPLLVSVRSGAPVSMPGMMDTILNLGLNEEAAEALAQATGSSAFVGEITARFHRMFSEIVLGADGERVEKAAEPILADLGPHPGPSGFFAALRSALWQAEDDEVGTTVPDDPHEQLEQAITAVFDSWNSPRAVTYRGAQGIADSLGTAVVVQMMVFGNLGSPSGSGVVFTRNPATGDSELYGEFLEGGQGEEVVGGTTTPDPIAAASQRLPEVFAELCRFCRELEELYRDVLDIEFTVERGKLYLLQVRSAKRTAEAAVRFAADFLREGRHTPAEALTQVTADHIRRAERPRFEDDALERARNQGALLGHGIGASPGQVSGVVVLDADRAVARAAQGDQVILARPTTSPLDLHGMLASVGILTALGGATSHAAVVARALGKPCVVGCSDVAIDVDARRFTFGGATYEEGAALSLDGRSGEIFRGALPTARAEASSSDLRMVLDVAREASRCLLYGMATTAEQVKVIRERGGAGFATRIGDLLATTGHFQDLLALLVRRRSAEVVELEGFEEVIAEVLTPLLAVAGPLEVTVRGIDLRAEEAIELLDAPKLLAALPRAALPLGVPELVRVQAAGLALAARRVGLVHPPELTLRHITDPRELIALRRLGEEAQQAVGGARIGLGATLTSTRGVQLISELAEATDLLWLDVHRLQAASFGYPPSIFLTGEPLDEYVRRGLLPVDPRLGADTALAQQLASVGVARAANPRCRVGVRLSGPVSEELVGVVYRMGCRVVAVDTNEVWPAQLALGKAALSEPQAAARGPGCPQNNNGR
jgi:pyruvate,orthophosphate dikinase